MRRIGPIYDIHMGLRLQDVDAGCGVCSKRLAEVIEDVSGQWLPGQHVCIDCGTVARATDSPEPWALHSSWRAPGKHVAVCQLCRYTSMPADLELASRWAKEHYEASHAGRVAS